MERWGVPVPHGDDEEKTELALSFDDAEFQHDPTSVGSNGATPNGANGRRHGGSRPGVRCRRCVRCRGAAAPGAGRTPRHELNMNMGPIR